MLTLEKLLARPLVGSDSQVCLAALLKGVLPPAINKLLAQSLATFLGGELFPSYGYVPSLVNVADDPTRHAGIRCLWLANSGYDPADALPIFLLLSVTWKALGPLPQHCVHMCRTLQLYRSLPALKSSTRNLFLFCLRLGCPCQAPRSPRSSDELHSPGEPVRKLPGLLPVGAATVLPNLFPRARCSLVLHRFYSCIA